MTMLNNIQTIILITMWMILMKMGTKNTKFLCLLTVIYSILASMLMSLFLKLTLIPFIMILTMVGGLMVLFLYFTVSAHRESNKMSLSPMPMLVISTVMIIIIMKTPMPLNSKSPLKEMTDPASMIFMAPLSSLTILMLLMLGMVLAAVIKICSNSKSFIRKSKM